MKTASVLGRRFLRFTGKSILTVSLKNSNFHLVQYNRGTHLRRLLKVNGETHFRFVE